MAYFDQDDLPQSRQLIDAFKRLARFPPRRNRSTPPKRKSNRLRSGEGRSSSNPSNFGRDLLGGPPPQVDRPSTARLLSAAKSRAALRAGAWSEARGRIRQRRPSGPAGGEKIKPPKISSALPRQSGVPQRQCARARRVHVDVCLIPVIMSAIAVVREKQTGSIANSIHADHRVPVPARKQLPYVFRRHGEFLSSCCSWRCSSSTWRS